MHERDSLCGPRRINSQQHHASDRSLIEPYSADSPEGGECSHRPAYRIQNGHIGNGHHQKQQQQQEINDTRSWTPAEYCYEAASSFSPYRRKKRSRSWCGVADTQGPMQPNADMRLYRERLIRTQPQHRVVAGARAQLRSFTHSQRLTLASLALVEFMSFCSMSIMAPFFPREAEEKGLSEAMSGFVFSFYALVMFVTSPLFGKILPVVGARFLFMSGIFLAGSCHLLFGVLEYIYDYATFTTFCLVIRGLEALGASAYSTASYVFVVHTFPDNIGSVLGILETFVGLGMSAGPAVGGLLYTIGGFALPFYVLGIATVLMMPVIYFLMPAQEEVTVQAKTGSIMSLIKVPAVLVTSLVIVIVSNVWAFLDPTLEPHLRQFDLSAEQIGLIFLLFSGLYGIFSPIWGRLADKITRHWGMMVWGLLFCSLGLLLLGPSPIVPYVKSSLPLNLIGLSIIGISVALTLMPTFQGVLMSSIEEGGCGENLATYSIVAGIWSCMYALGEVIGPLLGGVLLKHYGFPICSTIMAALTFTAAIIVLNFFVVKENCHSRQSSVSDSFGRLEAAKVENDSDGGSSEDWPLLKNNLNNNVAVEKVTPPKVNYGTADLFKNHGNNICYSGQAFEEKKSINPVVKLKCFCKYEKHCNGTKHYNNLTPPKPNNGDVQHPKLTERESEFLKYSLDKISFYAQTRQQENSNLLLDRNQMTDVRGTVNLSMSGACEV